MQVKHPTARLSLWSPLPPMSSLGRTSPSSQEPLLSFNSLPLHRIFWGGWGKGCAALGLWEGQVLEIGTGVLPAAERDRGE